jgi:hypothetical protein
MLGLSLPKLILTAVLIAAAWYGFKLLSGRQSPRPRQAIGDTERCAECGDYVATEAPENCGKAGCPYGRG